MIGPTGAVRVMVATKPVDFRKGAEGLAALVRETTPVPVVSTTGSRKAPNPVCSVTIAPTCQPPKIRPLNGAS